MTKKFISWNVNGLRACVGKGTFYEFLQKEDPDALCLQETKLQEGQIEMDPSDTTSTGTTRRKKAIPERLSL